MWEGVKLLCAMVPRRWGCRGSSALSLKVNWGLPSRFFWH